MTPPNELQQLDEDLAAGRLSAEDHRRRRDELVRDATGGTQVANPFPPAFRWETSSPEAPTQVMPVVGRSTGGGDLAAAPQAERTDAVPSTPFYRQEPGQVRGLFQPGNNSAGNNSDSTAPPWARSDLSSTAEQLPTAEQPLAEQQSAWIRHRPEVFETPELQPRSKQIVGIAVLGVLVVGLMGAGVAYFLSADSAPSQGIPQPAPSQTTAAARELPVPPAPRPAPVDTPQALIEPPGADRGGGGLLDLPRLESADLLPQPILNALRAGAMTDGVLKTTTDGGNTIGMFAFAVADEQAATDVVNTIVTVQRDGGLKIDQSRARQGLTVLGTLPGPRSTVYRGVYVLYNWAIFIEVFGPDYDAVLSTFDSLVDQQLIYAPPTVRGR